MKKFPVTIVDDFYENPELVRDFALSQKFYPSAGNYPGMRTDLISDINQNFYQTFCEKLFGLFYDMSDTYISWNLDTMFQKISRMSENKKSKFNEGWIHHDPCIFSGIIYLSMNSVGTNIYEPIDPNDTYYCQKERDIFYLGKEISEEEYASAIVENNSKFKPSVQIDGKFNRLVLFEGGVWHGVPSFYCNNEDRLTQVFFAYKISSGEDSLNYPIVRSKMR